MFDLKAKKSGYILYLVLTLLTMWGIISFSLSRYRSGAVNLLSKTTQQSRLTVIAQSAAGEIWSIARKESNNPGSKAAQNSFYNLINDVFSQNPAEVPPKKTFSNERIFNETDLPFANQLAGEITGGQAKVKGQCRLYFTSSLRSSPAAFSGHIEVITQAYSTSNRKDIVEIKERRDFKIIDTRDMLDRYVLFVKDYSFDYNSISRQLIIEGLRPKVCSSIFLGSRYAPRYPAFARFNEPPAIHLDINMKDDKELVPLVLNNKLEKIPLGAIEVPSDNSKARDASKGNVFWSVPMPMQFKPIFDRAGFSDSDFYSVKVLQDGYYKTFVETSQKTKAEEYSVPGLILDDWKRCGGRYADSEVFKMVVATSVEKWKYLYAYTDAISLWSGNNWSEFARTLQFTGLSEYLKFMETFHPDKMVAGKMAQFFGPDRNVPVILEGNVFFRFFKLAFFDEFTATITLGGQSKDFGMPSIPLHFQNPGSQAQNFLNKEVKVHGIEYNLMSREVEEVPVNSMFFGDIKLTPDGVNKPDDYYPYVNNDSVSYRYPNPEEFLKDRTITLANGDKRLDVDGLMFIEKGDLDLSKFSSFSGQGMIWLGFRGDILLGDLAKSKPSDILKLFAQDGSFIIKSPKPAVKISASLIALTYFSDVKRSRSALSNRGKLVAKNHEVEIFGNLAVDYLFLNDGSYGIPAGKSLKIIHDPFLFSPVYQKWATIGKIRTIFSVSTDYDNRVLK
ncbi:MAG: hypothetical protein ACOYXC_12525 [Candidatus Rifleibacteriota bacterium]